MIIRLTGSSDRRFDEFFGIYTTSLPVREQKTRREIESLIGRPDYRILVLEAEGHVLAFSIVFQSAAVGVALLEYMATDPAHRNAGLGQIMFQESRAAVPGCPMLIEVDSEREDSPDADMRIRRKNFYRRGGALQIEGLQYLLPLHGKGDPPMMDLLVHPNGTTLTSLRSNRLRQWLEVLFVDVYGQSRSDPRIARMLQPIGEIATLA
jgi:GNAT superfamily N-acetyltransferase